MTNHDFEQVFLDAMKKLEDDYLKGIIFFKAESDLQFHLFSNCLSVMKERKFTLPYQISSNVGLFSPQQKIDLVLGNNNVTVEIKFEPDNITLSNSRKNVVDRDNIYKDIERIKEYGEKGVEHSFFLLLDEDGQHKRNLKVNPNDWKILKTNQGKESYLLLIEA